MESFGKSGRGLSNEQDALVQDWTPYKQPKKKRKKKQ
jgi:hypothetical protein